MGLICRLGQHMTKYLKLYFCREPGQSRAIEEKRTQPQHLLGRAHAEQSLFLHLLTFQTPSYVVWSCLGQRGWNKRDEGRELQRSDLKAGEFLDVVGKFLADNTVMETSKGYLICTGLGKTLWGSEESYSCVGPVFLKTACVLCRHWELYFEEI